tara:strand:+ start:1929 stop:2396 length:468 start_codon:yes stop_codon:yes gene_type:complete
MSLKYTTGARTRNVVNLAVPGGTTPAYSLTAANSVPTAADDGFKNFNTQRMLHVLIHNNGLDDGSGVSIAASQITVYGYNSSLGGKWAPIRLNDRASGAETAVFPPVTIPDAIAKDTFYRLAVPIEGVERIAVYVAAIPTRNAGTLDIYLGVNSI